MPSQNLSIHQILSESDNGDNNQTIQIKYCLKGEGRNTQERHKNVSKTDHENLLNRG